MPDKKLTIYRSLDLQKPEIPQCSRLYSLEPIGVGTQNVESLTGYVARLADKHCVPTGLLILSELGSLIKPGYEFNSKYKAIEQIYSSNAARGTTRTLNGTGSCAARFAQALSRLTGVSDLRFLTLLTWAGVLPWMGLLRPVKAWCPICYQEWQHAGQVIYEPLLWAMRAITVCPIHYQRLLNQCPHCHKQFRPLEWRSRPSYCSKCGGWLGMKTMVNACGDEELLEDELQWQLHVIDQLGKLIASAPLLSSDPPRERVTKNIRACVNQVTQKNLSELARLLRKSPRHIQTWYTGKHIPQLNTLLLFCDCLEISLVDLLAKEIWASDSDTSPISLQGKRPQHPQFSIYMPSNYEEIKQGLAVALYEEPPQSVKQVIKRLGVSDGGNFYYHFSDLCCVIASRYTKYKKAQFLEERRLALERVFKENECPPPSLQEVARRFKYNPTTLQRNFPDLCHAISARYSSYRQAARRERIKQLCQDVRQAAIQLHARGVNPHSVNVGKLLTQSGAMRQREAQASLREVRRELAYETPGEWEET